MKQFVITYTEQAYYEMEVEAESMEEALDAFHAGAYDYALAHQVGVELEDSVEIKEAE